MSNHTTPWRHEVRTLLLAWAVLLALMLLSLGIAYLRLPQLAKLLAGLGIAGIKALVVALVFMELARGHVLVRVVAGAALAALLVMGGLSAVDYLARPVEPAQVQLPQTVP